MTARISSREAADLLGVSIQAISQRIDRGTVDAVRVGGRWMIDPNSLERKAGGRPRKKATSQDGAT